MAEKLSLEDIRKHAQRTLNSNIPNLNITGSTRRIETPKSLEDARSQVKVNTRHPEGFDRYAEDPTAGGLIVED